MSLGRRGKVGCLDRRSCPQGPEIHEDANDGVGFGSHAQGCQSIDRLGRDDCPSQKRYEYVFRSLTLVNCPDGRASTSQPPRWGGMEAAMSCSGLASTCTRCAVAGYM